MFKYQLIKRLNIDMSIEVSDAIKEENEFFMRDMDRQLKSINRHIARSMRGWKEPSYGDRDSLINNSIHEEEREKLHKAIARLPKTQRVRIKLRFFEDLSYKEIAKIEHCSDTAVRNSVNAALRRLHELLEKEL